MGEKIECRYIEKSEAEHAERWKWFLDVVFGAIVAIAIQKYEPVLRSVWVQDGEAIALSLFVTFSISSFVVYDISAYHILVKKYPYTRQLLGFLRFYLDLVMVFLLYLTLVNALSDDPGWVEILIAVSLWHLAASAWHLLATTEHKKIYEAIDSIFWHVVLVCLYWGLALLIGLLTEDVFLWEKVSSSKTVLAFVSAGILLGSLLRWLRVTKDVKSPGESA